MTMNDGDNDGDHEDVDDDADDDEDDDDDDNDVLEKALDWPWYLHLVSNRTFIHFLPQGENATQRKEQGNTELR